MQCFEVQEQKFALYGIGAVASLTGLSSPNIRMWEKRYQAVTPKRTESNRRLYSNDDVERLVLMKKLTIRGHTISTIAHLTFEELNSRLQEDLGSQVDQASATRTKHLLTVGSGCALLHRELEWLNAEVSAHYDSIEDAQNHLPLSRVDLVVIEAETLFPETVTRIRNLTHQVGTPQTLLSYRFATSKTVTALARVIEGVTLLKAPLTSQQLRRECLRKLSSGRSKKPLLPSGETEQITEALYSKDQLSKLTELSTTIECECPQHLASLLQDLNAFEKYSLACENRNPADAQLHAYLYRTTALVRRRMEEALKHLLEAEGIHLD